MKHLKEEIQKAISEKLITSRKHPSLDLWIYNYSPICQYDKIWTEVTTQCRGLILDAGYNVHARPFPKFFNYSELQPADIPKESFEVFTKLDGSLGIIYWQDNLPQIATRGSFESEQAQRATKILHTKYPHTFGALKKDRTYLFEIIYPENRIVIDYSGLEDLILLAVIDNETGRDLPLEDIGFPIVQRHDGINDIESLGALEKDNEEGFIIRFKSGIRCKLKFTEYVRLHKILTQTSNVAIWECLKNNQPLDELLDRIPDEFYVWVKKTISELKQQYSYIESSAANWFALMHQVGISRKDFARNVMLKCPHVSSILFNMLDGKKYDSIIWKMIRPQYSKPFKQEV